jgi:hypothetical protein
MQYKDFTESNFARYKKLISKWLIPLLWTPVYTLPELILAEKTKIHN